MIHELIGAIDSKQTNLKDEGDMQKLVMSLWCLSAGPGRFSWFKVVVFQKGYMHNHDCGITSYSKVVLHVTIRFSAIQSRFG